MHVLRTPDGKAHIYYDDPDLSDVSPDTKVLYPTLDVEHEHVELDTTVAEFERAAKEDAGIPLEEPLGEVFVEDEPPEESVPEGSQAFGSPRMRGRRVGGGPDGRGAKRVTAYAPQQTNAATDLRDELGRRDNQSVSWGELTELIKRLNGGSSGSET